MTGLVCTYPLAQVVAIQSRTTLLKHLKELCRESVGLNRCLTTGLATIPGIQASQLLEHVSERFFFSASTDRNLFLTFASATPCFLKPRGTQGSILAVTRWLSDLLCRVMSRMFTSSFDILAPGSDPSLGPRLRDPLEKDWERRRLV